MAWKRTKATFVKEFLHIVRDPRSLGLALLVPFLLLTLFGYALSLDVDRIPTVVVDYDRTPSSRHLISYFEGSRYFDIVGVTASLDAAHRSLEQGRALLILAIEQGFQKAFDRRERPARIQLVFDGSDSNTASIARSYVDALLNRYIIARQKEALQLHYGGEFKLPVDLRLRAWYNPELKSRNQIVPGLIAIILMLVATLLSSMSVAREWEAGTIEQLLSTPLRPLELIIGKMAAYFGVAAIDAAAATAIALLVFNVPMRGSWILLLVSSILFLIGALCWGILISAIAKSQLLAFQLSMLSAFLPGFLLSGFIFPIENMPVVVQLVTYIIPARYFIFVVQGIFLKNISLSYVLNQLGFLALFALLVLVLAVKQVGKRLA